MKVIAISSGEGFKAEIPVVLELFKSGLDILHLRKPNFSEHLMREYLNAIPENFHQQIVLHSFHELVYEYNIKGVHITKRHKKNWFKNQWKILKLRIQKPKLTISSSCHSLSHLKRYSNKYDYVFLSPVFNSISKEKRFAGFSFDKIKAELAKLKINNIYALGGVNASKIDKAKELGFQGVVLLGTLWKDNADSLKVFSEIKNKIELDGSSKMKIKPIQIQMV